MGGNYEYFVNWGTGILSTDVCALCIQKGYSVYILNRGKRVYAINKEAVLIKSDIRKESVEDIRKKLSGRKYDVVVDFLTYTPEQMKKTFLFLKGLCKQYIFISSATAYKKSSENEIISEDVTEIGNDKWSYAWNKSLAEDFLRKNYSDFFECWTVIRPYVTYNETRIPYAIVADGCYWALVNRINIGKPIVLWDGGEIKCTITNTKDFAVGVVGLFENEKAYFQAFHITSDEKLTWKGVLDKTICANGVKADVIDIPTDEIIKILPEFEGVLCGDKGTNMLFDNTKIKSVVPEFKTTITFEEGIKQTLNYLNQHKELQKINFLMEGRIDYLCAIWQKKLRISYDAKALTFLPFVKNKQIHRLKDFIKYMIGRNILLYHLWILTKKLVKGILNK